MESTLNIETVAELVAALQKLPQNARVRAGTHMECKKLSVLVPDLTEPDIIYISWMINL